MITPNPYIGAIARNFKEMKDITEASRPYEGTNEGTCWVNLETRVEIVTNL